MESLSQRDILRFPDQGVGEVWTDITGGPLRGSLTGREQLGEARGEVQVPPEVRLVELRVAREVQDLSFLADLHPLSLTYLGLEGPGLDDRTLGHVAQLTGLRELFLCSSTVTRRGLARLRPLHQLQSLSLFDLSLGDEVFEPVSQLGGLESLNLRGMTLTGEGLPTLAVLPRLRVLALDACALDPAGLQGLT
ncbi:MAG: hypothetical protein HY319_04965, partial [Armatimonadetes bacterium]|nr:hypothetical protein [Armatimonadota bacterium]